MILIEKTSARYKKILFVPPSKDLDMLPDNIKELKYDVIDLECEGFSSPIYDSTNNKIIEFDDTKDLKWYRDDKSKEIRKGFENEFENGVFLSKSIGIDVDCRRFSSKNDLDNVEILLEDMEREEESTKVYKGHTETKEVTISDLKNLKIEMQKHGLSLYKKRWSLEEQIKNASTIEEINNINW